MCARLGALLARRAASSAPVVCAHCRAPRALLVVSFAPVRARRALSWVMLFYAVLFMLFYAIVCCAILCGGCMGVRLCMRGVVLCYAMLCYAKLCSVMLF